MADAYNGQGRYDEAEAQYKQALDLSEKAQGSDSLEVARILNNLTKVYEEQSRFDEVEAAGKRALGPIPVSPQPSIISPTATNASAATKPVPVEEVQKLLGPGEGLVLMTA